MPAIKIETTNNGCINRNKGIPADLIATSSKLSPRLPKVMIDESSNASGNASGTQLTATRPIKRESVIMSSPLPTKSSIYSQKNCITNTNNAMKKVAKKGPMKDFIINLSSFLITTQIYCFTQIETDDKTYIILINKNSFILSTSTTTSLTAYEKQLVIDQQVLLAKNSIIQKVNDLFADLSEIYKQELNDNISGLENLVNPKISRGENYLGLPYVILDFPRQFGKTDVFAIRSFFWWGNFFSITLHLSGQHLQQYKFVLQNEIDKDRFSGWFISSSERQWDHHFEKDNYMPVSTRNAKITALPFIKLAKKIPLSQWDKTKVFFIENFLLIKTILAQAPIL